MSFFSTQHENIQISEEEEDSIPSQIETKESRDSKVQVQAGIEKVTAILKYLQGPNSTLEAKREYLSDIGDLLKKPIPVVQKEEETQYPIVSRKRKHKKINRLGYELRKTVNKPKRVDHENVGLDQKLVEDCTSSEVYSDCWKFAVCADQLHLLKDVSLKNDAIKLIFLEKLDEARVFWKCHTCDSFQPDSLLSGYAYCSVCFEKHHISCMNVTSPTFICNKCHVPPPQV